MAESLLAIEHTPSSSMYARVNTRGHLLFGFVGLLVQTWAVDSRYTMPCLNLNICGAFQQARTGFGVEETGRTHSVRLSF
jgi:hypothetical protein